MATDVYGRGLLNQTQKTKSTNFTHTNQRPGTGYKGDVGVFSAASGWNYAALQSSGKLFADNTREQRLASAQRPNDQDRQGPLALSGIQSANPIGRKNRPIHYQSHPENPDTLLPVENQTKDSKEQVVNESEQIYSSQGNIDQNSPPRQNQQDNKITQMVQ